MDKAIPLKELEDNVSLYASRVERGESFVVVKRSKPIFRMSPIGAGEEKWEAVVDFTKIRKGGVDLSDLITRL
jgi:antitoxin (DNA-binding transcriptional repressor) of toxin-antitoxin stability system